MIFAIERYLKEKCHEWKYTTNEKRTSIMEEMKSKYEVICFIKQAEWIRVGDCNPIKYLYRKDGQKKTKKLYSMILVVFKHNKIWKEGFRVLWLM